MIRSLSLALFADQELLYLLFLSALAAVVLIFLARKGLFDAVMERLHRNKGEEVETEVPSGYQKSRRPGRWNGRDGLAVTLITQLIKGIGWIDRIPTRITSYVVALVVLLAASAVAGELTWATAGLNVINAVVVALAANGAFDGVTSLKSK